MAGIDAGTAFVTVLPITNKFGPALTGQMNSSLAGTEKRLQQFRLAAGVALGLAGAAVIKFGADSVRAYREHEVALNRLQTALNDAPQIIDKSTKAYEDQATALQDLTGFQDEEVLAADTVLTRFGLQADQLRELTPLILDYARATGVDVAQAAGNVGRALLGNTRGLKTLGIEFTATGDRAKDVATIMKLLEERVGGTAEAFGKTSAGKIEIFKAKLDDLQESIGQALIPVLDLVVKSLGFVVDIFNSLPGPVKQTATVIAALGIAFVGLGLALGIVRKALVGYTGQAVAATVATEGLTVATGEAAVASGVAGASGGRLAGVLASLGPVGLVAAAAATSLAVGAFLQARAAEQAKKGNEGWSIGLGTLGNILNPLVHLTGDVGNRIEDVGKKSKDATPKVQSFRDAVGTMVAGAIPKLAAYDSALKGTTDALKNTAAAAVSTKGRIEELGNMATVKGGAVDRAFRRAINITHEFDSSVQGLHSQIVALPNGKIVNIVLPNIAKSISEVNRLKGEVFAVAGTYGITFNIHTNGNIPGGIQRTAKGGAFPRYAGGQLFGAPGVGGFIAGEANYPTPFGTGAEIASNAGVLPLNPAMIERLGHAIAAAGGSSGASAGDIASAMWPMIRELSSRPIVVQIGRREIARAVADEEAWTR